MGVNGNLWESMGVFQRQPDWLLRWQKNKNIKFSITYRGLLTKSYWIEGLCQIPIYKKAEIFVLI